MLDDSIFFYSMKVYNKKALYNNVKHISRYMFKKCIIYYIIIMKRIKIEDNSETIYWKIVDMKELI